MIFLFEIFKQLYEARVIVFENKIYRPIIDKVHLWYLVLFYNKNINAPKA